MDAENQSVTSDESSPSVILVDDTAEALDIVRTLEDNGVRVIHAADTLAAESLLVTTFPDLIVLNLNDEGAPAFCDLISAIPRGGGVPVILLTEEDGTAPAEVATILRGAHAFVPRPAKPQELLRKVFTLLGHRGVLPAPELDGNPPDEAEDVDRHHESMSSKLLLPGAEDMALAATEASGVD